MEKGDLERALALAERDLQANRLTPAWQLNLAHLCGRLGEFDRAAELVENAYQESAEVKDGYARVGWLKGTEHGDWREAYDWLLQDVALDRLSAVWQLNLAQLHARFGDWDQAGSLVESTYAENAQVKDGYARVGWLKGAEHGDWREAYDWLLQDVALDRLSSTWQLNLAELHARFGDWSQATALVEATYARNAQVKDGYARIGWLKGYEQADWLVAYSMFELDVKSQRLSAQWRKCFALLKVAFNQWDTAFSVMEAAYAEDPRVRGGYTELGWWGYLQGRPSEFFREQQERDRQLNRQDPFNKHLMDLLVLVTSGERIDNGRYKQISNRLNWLTNIGLAHLSQGEFIDAANLMATNFNNGQMTPVWFPTYAVVLNTIGERQKAKAVVACLLEILLPAAKVVVGPSTGKHARMTLSELNTIIEHGDGIDDLQWQLPWGAKIRAYLD